MPRDYFVDNRKKIEVTPAPYLMRSRFIYDVIKSGRKLVVDVESRTLEVMGKKTSAIKGPNRYYRFRSGGAILHVLLADNWREAREQLLDLSVEVPPGSFVCGKHVIPFNRGYRQFVQAVEKHYRGYK